MAYTDNAFCWHAIHTDDLAKTTAFYTDALGWLVQTVPMGDGTATLLAAADGVPRLHISETQDGERPHWSTYFRVQDVDAASRAAVSNGGSMLVPPTDIPPGRFSVVASPSGAVFSLFHEADPEATNAPAEGGIHWNELHSTAHDADVAWLNATFGLGRDRMKMPDGGDYTLLLGEDGMVAGAMPAQDGTPSMWLTWLAVDDLDAKASAIRDHGGTLIGEPMTVEGVGRMVVAQDPTGAVFGVIQPAPPRG